VAPVLLSVLLAAAIMVLYSWGLLTPTGLLLLGLVVVMSGILLGSRFSLYMVAASILALSGLEYAKMRGWISPDLSWMEGSSNASDVIVFSGIYLILGLTCWL